MLRFYLSNLLIKVSGWIPIPDWFLCTSSQGKSFPDMWIYAQVVNAYTVFGGATHLCVDLNTLLKETINPPLKMKVLLAKVLRQHVRAGQAL